MSRPEPGPDSVGAGLRRVDGDGRPGNTLRGRVPGSSAKPWLLLEASRWVVTAALPAMVFVVLVALAALDPAGLADAVASGDPVETLGQAFVTAVITGSRWSRRSTRSFSPRNRERSATSATAWRERSRSARTSASASPVAPPEPAAFLVALVEAARARSEALAAAVGGEDAESAETVGSYVRSLDRNAESIVDRLEGAQFGTFEVLFAALDFNYSLKSYETRRIGAEYDELPAEADDVLDRLAATLELFGPARERFKTLYFQWELINLSRAMLYAAVSALVVSVTMVLYLDTPGVVAGTTLGVHNVVWVVAVATTVALTPFALLVAYVLVATVDKRTLAIGPFVLRKTERTAGVDWGGED